MSLRQNYAFKIRLELKWRTSLVHSFKSLFVSREPICSFDDALKSKDASPFTIGMKVGLVLAILAAMLTRRIYIFYSLSTHVNERFRDPCQAWRGRLLQRL